MESLPKGGKKKRKKREREKKHSLAAMSCDCPPAICRSRNSCRKVENNNKDAPSSSDESCRSDGNFELVSMPIE